MISYVFLLAAILLLLGSLRFLKKNLQIARAAQERHDEVDHKFDVTKPSQEKLKKVTSAYEALQIKYQAGRRKLENHREHLKLYEVGSGTRDSVVFAEATKIEPVAELEAQLNKVTANLKKW